MKNFKLLKAMYDDLSKRGKVIACIITIIAVLGVLELLSGCSSVEAAKTWSF
jgi:hypothetical protein